MKADPREIYGAPTRAAAEADVFAGKHGAKYDSAVACLTKDREALAFFNFPAEHWDHLRTTKSAFATCVIEPCGQREPCRAKTAKLMVFKLVNAAAKTWQRLKGENQLPKSRPMRQIPKRHRGNQMAAHHAA